MAISYRWSIVTKSLSPAIFEILSPKHIGVVTLTFHGHVVVHCNQAPISSRFRDNPRETYWGHDFDLSGSHDVIGHVTIELGMGHFLLVVLWTQVSISNGFRDIPPQISCAHRHNVESLLRMRDVYPVCNIQVHILISCPTLPIQYATFIRLR